MLCKFGPSYLRQGGHSADLKQAQQGRDVNPFMSHDNKRSWLECPYFELNTYAKSSHGLVQFNVRGRMDEGLHNTHIEPPVEHEDDDVASTKGTINDPEDGFRALLQFDVLNNQLTIQVLGGTLRLTFPFEEVTKVDKIGERKIFMEIDHEGLKFIGCLYTNIDYRLGCFLWQSRRVKTWNFGFSFQSLDKRNFAAALIQGLKGLDHIMTHDNTSLVSNQRTLYVGRRKLKIWIGTWNMGNAAVHEELLDGSNPIEIWSMHHEPEKMVDFKDVFQMHELENDIYAFGVQEGHASVWPKVDEFMKSKAFTKVSSCQVGRISQSVYVRNKDVGSVNNVQTQNEAFGFAGVGVNKGTAAIGLTFRNQPLLFITSHLAARASQGRLRQRNYQAKLTLKRLGIGRIPNVDVTRQYSTFWFGDFNYRVKSRNKYWPNEELHRDDVIEIIKSDDSERLRELFFDSDQLTIEKEKGMVFAGFEEDHPMFYPSYKYHHFDKRTVWEKVLKDGQLVGYLARETEPTELSRAMFINDLGEEDPRVSGEEAEHYYLSLSAKQREYKENKGQCPSWCDRILHKALPTTQIVQKRYSAFDNIISSDHSPVAAEYEINIPKSQAIMRCSNFRVGAIQFLDVEIGTMRDPSVSIKQLFLDDDYLEEGHRPSSYYDEEAEDMTLEERGQLAEQAYKRSVVHRNKMRNKGRRRGQKATTASKRFSIRQGRTFTSVSSTTSRQQSTHSAGRKVQGKMSSVSFFGEEDGEQEESDVDNMPHSSKLLLAVQSPFLSYASIRRVLSSSFVDARTSRHTFLPMYPPYRIGELGEDCEFRWKTDDLYKMAIGPFFTTCEFLSTQYVVLHVLPKLPIRGAINDSVGSCTIRLNEAAFGEVVYFEEELHHLGTIIGTIRGRFRVLWDASGWDKNVNDHPLNFNNLHKIPVPTKQQTAKRKGFRFNDEYKSTEVAPVLYTDVKGEIFGQSADIERIPIVVEEDLVEIGPTKLSKARSEIKSSNGKLKPKPNAFMRMTSFNRSEKLKLMEEVVATKRYNDLDDENFEYGEEFEHEDGDSSDEDDKMTQITSTENKED